MKNTKMLSRSVRIVALTIASVTLTIAAADRAAAPDKACGAHGALAAGAQSKLAGLLLPKRTRLIINYKATMLA